MQEIITNMWNFIVSNIVIIKELFWIVFTLIATVVAVLTYVRARHTLLQPLRTEVIKRQTDLLVELLDFLYDDGISFYKKIDYDGLINCNVFFVMKQYGFILKDYLNEEIEKRVLENCDGGILLANEDGISCIELPEMFKQSDNSSKELSQKEKHDILKEKYMAAKKGNVKLEILFTTKKYHKCMQLLDHFSKNPFMPSKIQKLIEKLKTDIQNNLVIHMKETLEDFIIQLCDQNKNITPHNPLRVEPTAVYNVFNRKSIHHEETIEKIRKLTREYLMVDDTI